MNTPRVDVDEYTIHCSGGSISHIAAVGLRSLYFPCQVVISALSPGSNYFAGAQL